MAPSDTTGLLLINLGTPDSPSTGDVRRYLRQFLGDPRVVDLPAWGRWLLLNLVILPFRPRRSAEAYRQIWTEEGSPLLVHSRELAARVQQRVGDRVAVELGMRYGRPSLDEAFERLAARGAGAVTVLPLFPQYSAAATGSAVEAALSAASRRRPVPTVRVVPPFWNHPAYVDAFAAVARPHLDAMRPERVIFSFHGLPERQVRRGDASGAHCLVRSDCCDTIAGVNSGCYRAQCVASVRLLGDALGVPVEQRVLCFQSRLGRTPWIGPHTDRVLGELAGSGIRRAALLSPAFVADCLETIEELGIRGLETWKEHGGEELRLVPCLNASEPWADAVARIASEATNHRGAPVSGAPVHPRELP